MDRQPRPAAGVSCRSARGAEIMKYAPASGRNDVSMPVYGYARVSSDGQTLDAQIAQLKAAGAEKVFREKISGARADRPELSRLLRKECTSPQLMLIEIRAAVSMLSESAGVQPGAVVRFRPQLRVIQGGLS